MSETHKQLVIFMPTCDVCGLALVPSQYGWHHAYYKRILPPQNHHTYQAVYEAFQKAWAIGHDHLPACRMWAGLSALKVWRELTDQSVDDFLAHYKFD